MDKDIDFLTAEEKKLTTQFLESGYVIVPVEDKAILDRISRVVVDIICKHVAMPFPEDMQTFLNQVGNEIKIDDLNTLRLSIIEGMNAEPWFRAAYYHLAKQAINTLVGNELAMQRRINLSIQLPEDDSSLLPVHADVWSGDSSYEIVAWLPLVNCYETKSMYLLPPSMLKHLHDNFDAFKGKSSDDIYYSVQEDLLWLDVCYGHILLFNQNLPHGNRVNCEAETRWSMNCRFKSVYSPYADKKLGEFFEPITLRAMSKVGMDYQFPGSFKDESDQTPEQSEEGC